MTEHPTDIHSTQLLRLGEEVRRIARDLETLSFAEAPEPTVPDEDLPDIPLETINVLIRARRNRARFLPNGIFAEPAWDMMLDLLKADIVGQRVSVSSLCMASGVPQTTALRWINELVGEGHFVRKKDPNDRRRVYVELAPELRRSLKRYFATTPLPGASPSAKSSAAA